MNSDIYQKQYDFELEQRVSISSSTNTPVVALTVIGSALSTMVMSFPYTNNNLTYAFLLLVIFSTISIIISLIYIFKSFIGYSYEKVPSTKSLSIHYNDLLQWHNDDGSNETESVKLAKQDFEDYFKNRLSDAAEQNSNNNIKRGNFLHDSNVGIAVALVFLILSAPFYIYEKIHTNKQIHKVKIIEPLILSIEGKAMNSNKGKDSANTPQSTQGKKPTAAPVQSKPKPSGPTNTIFKGSVLNDKDVKTMVDVTNKGGNKK